MTSNCQNRFSTMERIDIKDEKRHLFILGVALSKTEKVNEVMLAKRDSFVQAGKKVCSWEPVGA